MEDKEEAMEEKNEGKNEEEELNAEKNKGEKKEDNKQVWFDEWTITEEEVEYVTTEAESEQAKLKLILDK